MFNSGGWDLPEVARAQRALVEQQLKAPNTIKPFAAFLRAMKSLPFDFASILDIGCGAGHYGALCARYFPKLSYTGVDSSPAMIFEAAQLCPDGTFMVMDFDACLDWEMPIEHDNILVSQVMEMCEKPQAKMTELLKRINKQTLILHRLRLTKESSHQIAETTYCGHLGVNYLWNLSDLAAMFAQHRMEAVNLDVWGDGGCATIVLRKNGSH